MRPLLRRLGAVAGTTAALCALSLAVSAGPFDPPKVKLSLAAGKADKGAKKDKVAKPDKKDAKDKKTASPGTVPLESLDISRPVDAKVRSEPGKRSKDQLLNVLRQFDVEGKKGGKRYQPRNGDTFCNIFARDVCYAMNVKMPHKLANALHGWLASGEAKAAGWKPADKPEDARKAAEAGKVAVAVWKNPTGVHGHICVVRPAHSLAKDKNALYVTNVGRDNFYYGKITRAFSAAKLKDVKYYVHD